MRAGISTSIEPASLVRRVREAPGMAGTELASGVTTAAAYDAAEVGPADQSRGGSSGSLSTTSASSGTSCARSPPRGSRRPSCPRRRPPPTSSAASTASSCPTARRSRRDRRGRGRHRARQDASSSGMRLGHQLLGLALGGRTYKMPFGHQGVNQPVRDARSGEVRIASHNHGFAVDPTAWEAGTDGEVLTASGQVELSHRNLNDDTLEGLRCRTCRPSPCSTTRRPRRAPTTPGTCSPSSGPCSWSGPPDAAPTRPVHDPRDRLWAAAWIGQSLWFDYSGTQACRVLRREGYRVARELEPGDDVTDPGFADRVPGAAHPGVGPRASSNGSARTPCCRRSAGRPA